ncbi:MAG: phenylacetate--CoA ligase family protein, partial [Rhodospirillaceae bacterium]|nr:phenylacetate--CoA ligase family protein [Rhodospirillaceae bacterium]
MDKLNSTINTFFTMSKVNKISEVAILPSMADGIIWPAIPSPATNAILSLAYQLEESQWWAPEVLTAFQLRQIENLLKHAWRSVPYYRQMLEDVVKIPTGMLRMDEFRCIPLLRKSDLQAHRNELKSRGLPKIHLPLYETQTSGSTGPPVKLIGTSVTELFHSALGIRWNAWHKRNLNSKRANIRFPLDAEAQTAHTHQSWSRAYTSGPMVTIGVNQPIEKQVEWLLDENPHYLTTFPSNLDALLVHCANSGIRIPNLREVSTRGESLSAHARTLCEQVWGVPLNDLYGAIEFGHIAMQCPGTNHYHIQSEHLLVEILDDDGICVKPGCTGRVVITDLHNFAMPLVRYEVEDLAVLGSTCSCGRGLPVIEKILGRTRSMFVLPTGDKYMPLYSDALFELKKVIPSIKQTKLIQRTRRDVTMRMVVSQALSETEELKVTKEMAIALGGHFEIQLEYVDEIS